MLAFLLTMNFIVVQSVLQVLKQLNFTDFSGVRHSNMQTKKNWSKSETNLTQIMNINSCM